MKEIPLTQGKVALVDDKDYEWLNQWKWASSIMSNKRKHRQPAYYARRTQHNKGGTPSGFFMHRLILGAPDSLEVDHIDGNGLNNQRSNLRLCTRAQNRWNARKPQGGTSRYKGVYWHKHHQRWKAGITVKGRRFYLGTFQDEIEAARAYDRAALEHFGEFARPNFT